MRGRSPLRQRSSKKTKAKASAGTHQLTLSNGLRVVLCPRPELAQVYSALYFGVGSRHESAGNNGITHILEHMLFRGTASFRNATALNTAAEDIGGYLEGATYRDHFALATASHPGHSTNALRLLGEMATGPRYRDLGVERDIIREELLETLDADGRMVELDNISHRAVFGRHGLGQPIEGTLEHLETVSTEDLENHRQRFCGALNATLAVAGPIDVAATERAAARHFAHLHPGETPPDLPPPLCRPRPLCRFVRDSSSQVDLSLSFRAPPLTAPEFPALLLLARLLADGLASRMHAELVDKRGLAYALHAGLVSYSDCGLFEFEATVAPHRAAELLTALLHFINGSKRFSFRRGERQRALRRYRYGIEFMADSASELAAWHGRNTLFGEARIKASLYHRLQRVQASDLRQAASRTFVRQGLVLTAVGELARGEWRRCRQLIAQF